MWDGCFNQEGGKNIEVVVWSRGTSAVVWITVSLFCVTVKDRVNVSYDKRHMNSLIQN